MLFRSIVLVTRPPPVAPSDSDPITWLAPPRSSVPLASILYWLNLLKPFVRNPWNVPALTVVSPELVAVPESVNWPVPFLTSARTLVPSWIVPSKLVTAASPKVSVAGEVVGAAAVPLLVTMAVAPPFTKLPMTWSKRS